MLAAAALSLATPAVGSGAVEAHPSVSPEHSVSQPVLSPAWNYQAGSAVARGNSIYLVVWIDYRRDRGYPRHPILFGTRVSPDGTILDPNGFAITKEPALPYSYPRVAVAWSGTEFLVVWADYRSGTDLDIYGARVDEQGAVLDPEGISIAAASAQQHSPDVGWDGSNFLVVWESYQPGTGTEIDGARVDPAGNVLDPEGIQMTPPSGNFYPRLAWNGTSYLIVWEKRISSSNTNIVGARVSSSGAVLDQIVICGCPDFQSWPAVASNGDAWLVVWGGVGETISANRVVADGSVLDGTGFPVFDSYAAAAPALAWNGTDYLMVVNFYNSGEGYDVRNARVSPQGEVVGTAVIHRPHGRAAAAPAVASGGNQALAVWEDGNFYGGFTETDILGARLNRFGSALDRPPLAVSSSANTQFFPAVAWDGTDDLVVWEDYRSGDADIYGARVDPSGVSLDGGGFSIAVEKNEQLSPAVAWDGTNFLVVFTDGREPYFEEHIYGARVSPQGTVLDPGGFQISHLAKIQQEPAVAWDGQNYLVAWQSHNYGGWDVEATRVSASGEVLDGPGIPVAKLPGRQKAPAVAAGAGSWLVVWEDHLTHNSDVLGARVDSDGAVLDPGGFPISAALDSQIAPSVAFDGVNYLVAWQDSRTGVDSNIVAARVDQSGQVLDPSGLRVSAAGGDQRKPVVVFDGLDLFVVWEDARFGTSLDLYGARVGSSGVVLDRAGHPVATSGGDDSRPAVAAGPVGVVAVVYDRFDGTSDYEAERAFFRTFEEG